VSLAERADKLTTVRSTDEHVEQAVAAKLDAGTRWLLRREIEQLPRLLPAGEEIELLAQGRLDEGTGPRRRRSAASIPRRRTMEIADYVRVRTSAPGEPSHTLGRQPARD